jgi:polysaccharide deacetylase family protein (PEP-CTERM system associated)
MRNILSVDVEEYFHPSEVQPFVHGGWSTLESRVERQTMDILQLFARYKVSATFFVVGWVAEKQPGLVRSIAAAGHELGCHSYAHRLVYDLTPQEFRNDTERAMKAIADASGVMARTYRAPSYSITKECTWALDVLAELGFTHDSSIYPIVHDRYGIPGFQRHAHTIQTPSGEICEVPIATIKFANGRTAPVGGGGYLRLLPYRYTAAGIRKLNGEEQQPACVYFHPWEIDPQQPRLADSMIARMRTYTGLRSMLNKVERLLVEFEFDTMTSVHPARVPVSNQHTSAAFA